MRAAIFERASGKVTHIGIGTPDSFLQFDTDTTGYVETALTGLLYFDGDTVVAAGTQPTPHHTFNYATKQWEPDTTLADANARQQRARFLAQSDWTQLPDVPLATKEDWAIYRQALRDITEQPGYPLDVVWPESPSPVF